MHRALLISEVVSQVFEFSSSGTCTRAAVVCQAWMDPALDVVWCHLGYLGHILHPLLSIPDIQRLCDLELQSVWARFDSYARRVKTLFIRKGDGMLLRFTHQVVKFRPPMQQKNPLFPTVTTLLATVLGSDGLATVCDLLSPSMKKLGIEADYNIDHIDPSPLFTQIATRCPALVVLHCAPSAPRSQSDVMAMLSNRDAALTDLLSNVQELQLISIVHPLNSTHLSQLSLMADLRQVRWTVESDWATGEFNPEGSFDALRTVDGVFSNSESAVKLLQHPVLRGKLRVLAVNVATERRRSLEAYRGLVQVIALHSSSLHSLNFAFRHANQVQNTVCCTYYQIQPLAQCTQLIKLRITYDGRVLITNDELLDLVASMKNLTHLNLLPSQFRLGETELPALTLTVLPQLVKICPHLTIVSVYLDARVISWQDGAIPDIQFENLVGVNFGLSPINSRLKVAMYLSRVAVPFVEITGPEFHAVGREMQKRETAWKKVGWILENLWTDHEVEWSGGSGSDGSGDSESESEAEGDEGEGE